MAQVGVEPTASLVLSESGRPVAYRAGKPEIRIQRSEVSAALDLTSDFRLLTSVLCPLYSVLCLPTPGVGVEPTSAGSKPASLTISRPRNNQYAVGSGSWQSIGSSAANCRLPLPTGSSGRRGSRTLKAHRSVVFGTTAIANWLALPYYGVRDLGSGIRQATRFVSDS